MSDINIENREWKIEIEHKDKLYIVKDKSISIYEYTNRPFGNGFGTKYELTGKKTVIVNEWNNVWACRGMGMNDSRSCKLVNQELYNKIKATIEKIKEIEQTVTDEDEKYEREIEVLESVDIDMHENYY
jgi:hypothetical protein